LEIVAKEGVQALTELGGAEDEVGHTAAASALVDEMKREEATGGNDEADDGAKEQLRGESLLHYIEQ